MQLLDIFNHPFIGGMDFNLPQDRHGLCGIFSI